jgi:PAS domain S-box-containing protein
LIVAFFWILLTDRLVEFFLIDSAKITAIQTYKGWFYVIATTLGLYYLITKYEKQQTEIIKKQDIEVELRSKLLNRIPVMITMYDPDLGEIKLNKAFTDYTGYTNEVANTIDLMKACYPDPEYKEELIEFMGSPETGWKEVMLTTKNGEEIFTSWTNISLSDNTQVGIGINLTEIRKAEQEKLKNEQVLKNVFESLEESVFIIEPGSRVVMDCNRAAEELLGYTKKELIGNKTQIFHVDEEHFQKFNDLGMPALESENVFRTEYKLKRKDDKVIDTDHTVTITKDEDGNIKQVVSVIRDITERKKAQNELKERNRFIEAIINNIPMGIAVNSTVDGKATLVNKQFYEIYGWPWEILSDVDSFFEHVYQDAELREAMKYRIMEDLASGDPERMQWKRIPIDTQNDGKRHVNAKNIPLTEQNLMISTVMDVSDRVRTEEEIKKSEELYRHLFSNSPQPMWVFDKDTLEFLEVNSAAVDHYGYTGEEFLSMTIADIRPQTDLKKLHRELINPDIRVDTESEWTHLKKNGEQIIVNVHGTDIEYAGETARLILINDITQKNKNRELLIQAAIQGEDRERKRLAQEIHDGIGQYISAINLNLASLKKEVPNFTEARKKRFHTALDLTKKAMAESRSMAYNLMPTELEEYGLKLAVETLLSQVENSGEIKTELNWRLDENILKKHTKTHLYRIIQESINNSIKHGKSSLVAIDLMNDNEYIYCKVKDNGEGKDMNKKDIKFGIGIRSIETRALLMGGELEISSEREKGFLVDVQIPI